MSPHLSVMGLLPTRVARTTNAREVLEHTREALGSRVCIFEPAIPETVKFREAAGLGQTIYEHAPESAGAAAYLAIAKEFLCGRA